MGKDIFTRKQRIVVGIVALSATTLGVAVGLRQNSFLHLFSQYRRSENPYTITLGNNNAYSSGASKVISTDSGQWSVTFNYSSCSSSSGNHASISEGGYIVNAQQITSIETIKVVYEGGSLKCQTSYDGVDWNAGFVMASDYEYATASNPYFVKFTAESGTISLKSAIISYSCLANQNIPDPVPAGNSYDKVTTELSDYSGEYLIVFESQSNSNHTSRAFDGSLSSLDAEGNIKTVTITNGSIAATEALNSATFTIAKSGEKYTIRSHSGYYIGRSEYSNGLETSASTQFLNDVSFEGDEICIAASSGCVLRYNDNTSNGNRFRYYKGTQQAIQLYAKNVSEEYIPSTSEAVGLIVSDSTTDYTTNDKFANSNGLSVTAVFSDGTSRALASNEYTYNVYRRGREDKLIDPTESFELEGTYVVVISYQDLIPSEIEFQVGEYIYATDIALASPKTSFTTDDKFADYLDQLSADISFSNSSYDVEDLEYNKFAVNNLSVQLLNPSGVAYNLNNKFNQDGDWQIKLNYDYKGVSLSTLVDIEVQNIPVTNVTLDRATLSLEVGNTGQLVCTVNPSNATDTSVVWTSSNTAIATVSSSGLVTAVAAGTATITATSNMDGTKKGECAVTVTKPAIVNTEYLFTSSSWNATCEGSAANWTSGKAGNGYSNSGVQVSTGASGANATSPVSFTDVKKVIVSYCTNGNSGAGSIKVEVGSTTIADLSVTKTGGTTARNLEFTSSTLLNGKVKITVTCTTNSIYVCGATISCNNNSVYPTEVSLTGPSSVNVGETIQLTGSVTAPSDCNRTSLSYVSDNTAVATVSATGQVTGVKAGTATITVTGEAETGKTPASATKTITVSNVSVSGVSVSPTTKTLAIGESFTLTATVAPSNATNKGVTFTSSNTSVATVDSTTGSVAALAAGTTTITVTTTDGSKTASCTVTVSEKKVESISISPNTLSLKIDASYQLSATVLPANASNKNYTWSSSDETVATVSSTGSVTARKLGSANIYATATDGSDVRGTCAVTVTDSSVTPTPVNDTATITVNDSETSGQEWSMSASDFEADGITLQSVSSTKLFGTGENSIRFSANKSSGSLTLNFDSILISGVILHVSQYSSETANIKVVTSANSTGETIAYNGSGNTIEYTTFAEDNDESTSLTISSGSKNRFYLSQIELITGAAEPIFPTAVSISNAELGVGQSTTLTPVFTPAKTNQKQLTWSSSNTGVATVDSVGKVTAKAAGTATITVRALTSSGAYVSDTATITVTEQALDAWTIMLYICGADLESENSLASGDIAEILKVSGQPDDVNIIIQTGGANKNSGYFSTSKMNRYHVEGKSMVSDGQINKANMGLSSTFQNFLEWGLTEYPAQKTGVVFWNHGGGMFGCCYDELYNDDSLSNKECKTAFTNAFKTVGRTDKLEFVGYDCCLMQVQDIADFNSDYFNYMIASEESEAGYGWDYDNWVDDLYAKKSTTVILKAIVDSFIADNGGVSSSSNDQTLSYLDLNMSDAYFSAFESFASGLKSKFSSSSVSKSTFASWVISNIKHYADDDYDYFCLFDAKDFISTIASNSTYNPGSSYTNAVLSAFNNFVLYSSCGRGAGDSYGLCLCFAAVNNQYATSFSNVYTTSNTNYTTWRSFASTYGYIK